LLQLFIFYNFVLKIKYNDDDDDDDDDYDATTAMKKSRA